MVILFAGKFISAGIFPLTADVEFQTALLRTEPMSTTYPSPWLPDHKYLVLKARMREIKHLPLGSCAALVLVACDCRETEEKRLLTCFRPASMQDQIEAD
jgi:hypothetical protein